MRISVFRKVSIYIHVLKQHNSVKLFQLRTKLLHLCSKHLKLLKKGNQKIKSNAHYSSTLERKSVINRKKNLFIQINNEEPIVMNKATAKNKNFVKTIHF